MTWYITCFLGIRDAYSDAAAVLVAALWCTFEGLSEDVG